MKKKIFISVVVFLLGLIGFSVFSYFHSFELKGKKTVEVALGKTYQEEGVQANLFFLPLRSLVRRTGTVDTEKVGTYEITYHLPFQTLKRTVIVKDKNAPVITLHGENPLTFSYGQPYVEEGFEALDDVDQDVTDRVKVTSHIDEKTPGTYEVVYEVTDTAQNQTSVTRTVTIVDDQAPTLELEGNDTIYISVGATYTEPGYHASDNYDGDVTSRVVVDSKVDIQTAGTYSIHYSVEDSFGNRAEKSRTVVVRKSDITYIRGILLVNKTHSLPSNYAPGENQEARNALTELQQAAAKQGYSLPLLSGYRSYSYQKTLYQNYVNRDGEEKANTYSAKPGQSEHQTGLAFDVGDLNSSFGRTPAGIWLKENAHLYGFIIRYPQGKESITGYAYEPWHVRYLGVSVATEVYQQGVTLEEYLGVA